ncbi:orotidine-5'-phosphate decarboxylase [Leekyejoonella antrihumi]|uniref:Orotidine 5'-phosphate decarboxylase n=1 Tax=Leekyejoonella antrihumi TaxID=1660198 RepID=A0A563DX59_9MICO|nr:orotidine-5'-phosphate decarboxylase [Leekyejoonella antrihumi]TWP34850.1 orotidine-5'-phosphate decarboxylase [Leekyejoonella antrihumi]
MAPFGVRLQEAVDRHGPLCVGIDPHPELLRSWDLCDDIRGLRAFAEAAVEAFSGNVAVVKPQSAFFERFGSDGVEVLEDTLAALKEEGTLSLLDVKRGDIGSTMQAYATAYLGDCSPLAADAVTLSPYLGFESLRPAYDLAAQHGRGVFVLSLTSNPEARSLQHAQAERQSIAGAVIESVGGLNADEGGDARWGSFGVVIGATVGDALHHLRLIEPLVASRAPVLAPGMGAQGATAESIRRTFGDAVGQVLPTTSRAVLSAGPSVRRLRDAVLQAQEDVAGLRP